MSNVTVQKIRDRELDNEFLNETGKLLDRVRERAFELFQRRGGDYGNDIDDWLRAERELFDVPSMELTENDGEFQLQLELPGFDAKDIHLTTLPDSFIIEAENTHQHRASQGTVRCCEFGVRRVFRQIPLPESVDVDRVSATLDRGILEVHAPKSQDKGRKAAA